MNPPASSLAELFPEGDYRFHLTLRRGEPRDFFCPQDATGAVLAERTRWLGSAPSRYAALRAEGGPLLAEFAEQLGGWLGENGNENPDEPRLSLPVVSFTPASRATVVALGFALEPDFVLLAPDSDGLFRLVAGAVCFPSGWALEEKIGLPLASIHDAVPGLNPALESPIQQFLARLKPGAAFLRSNWGLAATHELNLHPRRRLPSPTLPVALDRLWLRVEHQALVALPRTGGILFGIRIELHRLDAVVRDPAVALGLRRALESMPPAMATYKGLGAIRASLIEQLTFF